MERRFVAFVSAIVASMLTARKNLADPIFWGNGQCKWNAGQDDQFFTPMLGRTIDPWSQMTLFNQYDQKIADLCFQGINQYGAKIYAGYGYTCYSDWTTNFIECGWSDSPWICPEGQ
jgi:hypothetical protein